MLSCCGQVSQQRNPEEKNKLSVLAHVSLCSASFTAQRRVLTR